MTLVLLWATTLHSSATKLSWRWNHPTVVSDRGTEASAGGMAKHTVMTAIPLRGCLEMPLGEAKGAAE